MLKVVVITIIIYELITLYITEFDHSILMYQIKQYVAYIIALETAWLVGSYREYSLIIIAAVIYWFIKSEEARSEFNYYLAQFSEDEENDEEGES